MRGAEKHPTSTAPSSQGAFSLAGWRLRELGWVGAQSCLNTVPERAYVMEHHALTGPESWQAQYCPQKVGD